MNFLLYPGMPRLLVSQRACEGTGSILSGVSVAPGDVSQRGFLTCSHVLLQSWALQGGLVVTFCPCPFPPKCSLQGRELTILPRLTILSVTE